MIPIAKPLITDEDKHRVLAVLDSGHLVAGQWVAEFERAFGAYVGARHAVATSSGTTALMVALEAAGIPPGSRVITTPLTFGATANAILHRGARPVFVDIDPRTYNLDPQAVEEALRRTPDVRAMVVVHLYGLPCPMDSLGELARRHGLTLIEDAAQAHGARYRGRHVGTFGAAGVFSFYPSKNVTTGKAGWWSPTTPGSPSARASWWTAASGPGTSTRPWATTSGCRRSPPRWAWGSWNTWRSARPAGEGTPPASPQASPTWTGSSRRRNRPTACTRTTSTRSGSPGSATASGATWKPGGSPRGSTTRCRSTRRLSTSSWGTGRSGVRRPSGRQRRS